MTTTIVSVIANLLPVFLKIIEWYFTKINADKEMIDSWKKFLEMAQNKGYVKVALWMSQKQAKQELIDELNGESSKNKTSSHNCFH